MSVTYRAPASHPRNQDHIELGTIHTLAGLVPGDSVVFAFTQSRRGARTCLAFMLMRALARLDPRWCIPSGKNTHTLQKNALGRPCLLIGDKPGPSLSFSHGEGRIWAAMCDTGSVGIDVAYPEEFAGDYPFARAFRPEELDFARELCHNDTTRGLALIWSAKEASVKATGAGFNRLDPLDVRVGAPLLREQGILFEVLADRPISVWAKTEGRGWLSVALRK
jgi:phosphopantetheinyl transferase